MAKSLDAIKKLNPEEKKRYRNLVLNYIGEGGLAEKGAPQASAQAAVSAKKVDGLIVNKINNLNRQSDKEEKIKAAAALPAKIKLEPAKVKWEKIKNAERETRALAEVVKKRSQQAALARQLELKKQAIDRARAHEVEAKRLEELAKNQAEKIKLAELKKAEEEKIKENLRFEESKRQLELKRVKEMAKAARLAAKRERRIKRQQALRKFRRDFNLRARNYYFAMRKNMLHIVLFSALAVAIFYLLFCLLVLRLKLGNNFMISQALKYLPVPAVITSQGVIGFNDFIKINNPAFVNLSLLERKRYLASWIMLNNLKQKYQLTSDAPIDMLAIKYVLDNDFNQSGLSRINKINELLSAGQTSLKESSRYADEYYDGIYLSLNEAAAKFGPEVLGLTIGQTSGLVARADGYYLIQRLNNQDNKIGLRYLFVKARTLEQYFVDRLHQTRVLILANWNTP